MGIRIQKPIKCRSNADPNPDSDPKNCLRHKKVLPYAEVYIIYNRKGIWGNILKKGKEEKRRHKKRGKKGDKWNNKTIFFPLPASASPI
jgi:hypothetical protein